jgi:hypothetical protein
VKLLLAELSIAYIIIASSHNRRRPFHFLTNRRRNRRQNLILPKITFPLKIHQSHICVKKHHCHTQPSSGALLTSDATTRRRRRFQGFLLSSGLGLRPSILSKRSYNFHI